MSTALDVAGLVVSYGARRVLDGVSISVAAGEVVGLVGPNGCGKTTLLKALTRVVRSEAGEIRILGAPLEPMHRREVARQIAIVPQLAGLPAELTVLTAVLMGRTPHLGLLDQEGAEDYEVARQALRRVGAADLADRRIGELSGGERQTVLLGRALAQGSPVLLLDEPTASLDIGHQIAFFQLAGELARHEGYAVLAALHDLTLASLYCDRLVLMAAGRVVAEGLPREVLTEEHIRRAYGARATLVDHPGMPGPIVVPFAS